MPGITHYVSVTTNDEASKFLECVQDCFLMQHVRFATRGNSLLDLVMTSEPELIDEVSA